MSKFIYLLNALEIAAQSNDPYGAGYKGKREAVLEYVAKLESLSQPEELSAPRRCTCYVLPHADDCGLFVGITQSGERVFAEEYDREAILEEAARACEKRAERRFDENGTREPDTGATYYGGRQAEELEARDEEDADCAAAIRALKSKIITQSPQAAAK